MTNLSPNTPVVSTSDWRTVFCGRQKELTALLNAFESIQNGGIPRAIAILGDRGMGKTRLIQEFYKQLSLRHDPQKYWPAQLPHDWVAPKLDDAQTRAHYESFPWQERPIPYVWWGFRVADSIGRNGIISNVSMHLEGLHPHLANIFAARALKEKNEAKRDGLRSIATDVGKVFLDLIPGVSSAITAIELADKCRTVWNARLDEKETLEKQNKQNLTYLHVEKRKNIIEITLDDISDLMKLSHPTSQKIPFVVFCDDAQFCRQGQDEGTQELILRIYQKACEKKWPLLLVLTHWHFEWTQDNQCIVSSENDDGSIPSLAYGLLKNKHFLAHGQILRMTPEASIDELIHAALPQLPAEQIQILSRKSDGNPQVLIELIEKILRYRAWLNPKGHLTPIGLKKIKEESTNLVQLILARLESEATPDSVRHAAAISSAQGMRFLELISEDLGKVLGCENILEGIHQAHGIHHLTQPQSKQAAQFVQRAYLEASQELAINYLGLTQEELEQYLVDVCMVLRQDANRWGSLDQSEQDLLLGLLIGFNTNESGKACLELMKKELNRRDSPAAAHYALIFSKNILNNKWKIQDFNFPDMQLVVSSISDWDDPRKSLPFGEKLLGYLRVQIAKNNSIQNRRNFVTIANKMGIISCVVGKMQDGLNYYIECLNIQKDLVAESDFPKDRLSLVKILNNLGAQSNANGNKLLAEQYWQEGLKNCRILSTKMDDVDFYRILRTILFNLSGIRSSEKSDLYQQECLIISRHLVEKQGSFEDKRNLASILSRLGTQARLNNDVLKSKKYYDECLNIRRLLDKNPGLPRDKRYLSGIMYNFGLLYNKIGDFEKSLFYFKESLIISSNQARNLNLPRDRRDQAETLNCIALLYQEKKDFLQAQKYFEECLSIRRNLVKEIAYVKDKAALADVLKKIGFLHIKNNMLELARKNLIEALSILQEISPGKNDEIMKINEVLNFSNNLNFS